MRNGNTIVMVSSFVLAIFLWLPARSEDQPIRAHYFGNSLTDQLKYDYFKKLCTEAGHPLDWKREMAPGVPVVWHWGQKAKWEEKLIGEKWDVVTLQPFGYFEVEYPACENFAKFLQEKQPDAQLYIYAQWQERRTGNWLVDFSVQSEIDPQEWRRGYKEKTDPQFWLENVAGAAQKAGFPAKVERSLKNQYELTVQGLNARVPMKNPVRLIPVGHVMELLYSKMRAGLVPGHGFPYETYVDGIHLNNVGCYIVACTFYATIFQTSPVGLPVGDYQAGPHFHGPSRPISDELAKIIQETVCEVVATHPLTGVTCNQAVKVATASLEPAIGGEPYRFQLYHAFGKEPCAWSMADGELPEGLNLDDHGLISGTPADEPGSKNLSVAVKVIDPDRHLKLGDPAEQNLPFGDSVELFVDVLNNREAVYNYDDRRIGIAPAKGWYRMICVSPTGSFGHTGKCVETEDGYTAEFWLNFWALDYRNRNFFAVIGLDIAINDDDDGNGRDSQVVWQGTARNGRVPQFGTVILEAKANE